jgi:hypothetical protein
MFACVNHQVDLTHANALQAFHKLYHVALPSRLRLPCRLSMSLGAAQVPR